MGRREQKVCYYYYLYSQVAKKHNIFLQKCIYSKWNICDIPPITVQQNKASHMFHVHILLLWFFIDYFFDTFFHGCISGHSKQVIAQPVWKKKSLSYWCYI